MIKTSEEDIMDLNWKGNGLKRRSNKVAEDVVFEEEHSARGKAKGGEGIIYIATTS